MFTCFGSILYRIDFPYFSWGREIRAGVHNKVNTLSTDFTASNCFVIDVSLGSMARSHIDYIDDSCCGFFGVGYKNRGKGQSKMQL